MTDETKIQLTPRQKNSLTTAAVWAEKRDHGRVPRGAIPELHWARFVELGLASPVQRFGRGPVVAYELTERGKELAATLERKAGPGKPRRATTPSETKYQVRFDDAEAASVRAYAAKHGANVSEVIREGLRAIGALS